MEKSSAVIFWPGSTLYLDLVFQDSLVMVTVVSGSYVPWFLGRVFRGSLVVCSRGPWAVGPC